MTREAGQRVGAILSGNAERVKFLGWGVYQGDLLRPNWEQEARVYLPIVRHADVEYAQQSVADWLKWHAANNDWLIEKGSPNARTDEEVRALAQESYDKAQAKLGWTDEQVVEDMKGGSLLTNPCILLDSGKTVWGMECWWGDEESVRERLAAWEKAGAQVVTVDVEEARRVAS